MNQLTMSEIAELIPLCESPLNIFFLDRLTDKYAKHTHTRHNYYRFFYHLVKKLAPFLVVELGVEFGLFGVYVYAASEQRPIGFDMKKVPADTGHYYISCQGDTVYSHHFLDAFVNYYGKVGLLFQDSSHHYAHSCREWDVYKKYLAPGAIWVCDDITPAFQEMGVDKYSMVEYWENYLPNTNKKQLFPDVLHRGNTMGVMICQ